MREIGDKCHIQQVWLTELLKNVDVSPKAQANVLLCLLLSITHRYSIYCQVLLNNPISLLKKKLESDNGFILF